MNTWPQAHFVSVVTTSALAIAQTSIYKNKEMHTRSVEVCIKYIRTSATAKNINCS